MNPKPTLGLLLKLIHNAIEKDCNGMLREINLTSTQRDILMYLLHNRDREIHQKDIEEEFGIQNPTVTGILKRMEEKGLIRRSINLSDYRCKQIIVTAKSIQMQEKILQKGEQIDTRVAEGLSTQEQEQLRTLLSKVLRNLS